MKGFYKTTVVYILLLCISFLCIKLAEYCYFLPGAILTSFGFSSTIRVVYDYIIQRRTRERLDLKSVLQRYIFQDMLIKSINHFNSLKNVQEEAEKNSSYTEY